VPFFFVPQLTSLQGFHPVVFGIGALGLCTQLRVKVGPHIGSYLSCSDVGILKILNFLFELLNPTMTGFKFVAHELAREPLFYAHGRTDSTFDTLAPM
jgi:hypothetical protein